ncbi:MAG TPA: leucyl/phenylalanyl-tRNA--protein transferase [Hellea balneolensis]|uniref:Leucyl/phenylalanyl-tRNA--protein transferase n=1 Tax=Hellea balneolensis TaxID=287478 RepID=A0A7C5LW59_9PROT|nr:leucyl/phenylalanyl-tRNA--protein transferase [Hellea balneolensis]
MSGFGPRELLSLYASGVFPMAESKQAQDVFIVDPDKRGIIPLDGLHISKSLAKTVRSGRFHIRINTAFPDVVKACAAKRPDQEDTWINGTIFDLYLQIHDLGYAHSVECWQEEQLVGGLYGVHLGQAFFGESMFSRQRDASKVALVHLVGRLKAGGFKLLDTQFLTDHLARLGAIEISRAQYHTKLEAALQQQASFYPKNFDDSTYSRSVVPTSRKLPTQSSTQIS